MAPSGGKTASPRVAEMFGVKRFAAAIHGLDGVKEFGRVHGTNLSSSQFRLKNGGYLVCDRPMKC